MSRIYNLLRMMVIGVGLIATSMPFSLAESPTTGESTLVPITVTVQAQFSVEKKLQDKLITISQDLIRKNISEVLAKSSSANAETNIIKRTAKGYVVEIIVMSLFKETFTAQMSRIEFTYEEGKVTLLKVERSFQPK